MKLADKFNRFCDKLKASASEKEQTIIRQIMQTWGAEATGMLLSYFYVLREHGVRKLRIEELGKFFDEFENEQQTIETEPTS